MYLDIWMFCIGFIYTTLMVAIGFIWGKSYQIRHSQRVQDLLNDAADNARVADRFRIRTAESDLNSNAHVRTARLRAYRPKPPPPRR